MSTETIKTPADLREAYYRLHPDGHFFDKDTLKFFGERLSEMCLWADTYIIFDNTGKERDCFILSSVQRPPYGPKKRKYHCFDADTLEQVIPDDGCIIMSPANGRAVALGA